jgi:hypothetical protein
MIVMQDRVLWSLHTDSHDGILSEYKIPDKVLPPAFVRVEIAPKDNDLRLPVADWQYKVDQDVMPTWFDAADVESRARAALPEWASARLVQEGERVVSVGHVYVADRARATLYGRAQATLYGRAQATLYDSAQATLYDSAQATLCDSAQATLYDSAQATLYGSAQATLYGSAQATLYGSAQATLYDSAQATLYDSAQATFYDSAQATIPESPYCVIIDRRNGIPVVLSYANARDKEAPQ